MVEYLSTEKLIHTQEKWVDGYLCSLIKRILPRVRLMIFTENYIEKYFSSFLSRSDSRASLAVAKGSRKNKFAELVAQAPSRQGVKMHGILGICRIFTTQAGGMHQLSKCEVIFARALSTLGRKFGDVFYPPIRKDFRRILIL
jgi:hypothetical protein